MTGTYLIGCTDKCLALEIPGQMSEFDSYPTFDCQKNGLVYD